MLMKNNNLEDIVFSEKVLEKEDLLINNYGYSRDELRKCFEAIYETNKTNAMNTYYNVLCIGLEELKNDNKKR